MSIGLIRSVVHNASHLNKVATLLLILSSAPLAAAEQTVGSTKIKFSAPIGQCEVSGLTAAEALINAKMRELLSPNNQLLSVYADCAQLERFRSANSEAVFDDFAQYVVPNMAVNSVFSADIISRVCAAAKARNSEDLDAMLRGRAADANRIFSGLNIHEVKFMGVLAEEPGTCYTGILTRMVAEGHQETMQVGIVANVLIKGKLITYQLYGLFRNNQSVTDLLTKHKTNVIAFKSANTQ